MLSLSCVSKQDGTGEIMRPAFWYSVGPLWLGLFCLPVKELYGTRYQSGLLFLNFMWGVVSTACVVFLLFSCALLCGMGQIGMRECVSIHLLIFHNAVGPKLSNPKIRKAVEEVAASPWKTVRVPHFTRNCLTCCTEISQRGPSSILSLPVPKSRSSCCFVHCLVCMPAV